MNLNPKPTDALQLIAPFNLERIEVPARTVLLNEGEKAKNIYFVEKGCLRMWFNSNGTEITSQFFMEGKVVASTESLLKDTPSDFVMETIEPSILYVMPKKLFFELMETNAEFKEWFEGFILNRFFYYSKHLLSFLKDTPQERYNELLKNNPEIIKRLPQHYIASYLGITPVSLSRIRNRK